MEPESLSPDHVPETARALARAFRDNAGFVHGLRGVEADARERKLVRMMGSFARACIAYGDATIVRDASGSIGGAALAYPPGAYPLSFAGWIRNGWGALGIGPSHTIRLARLDSYMAKRHIKEPHWYLFVLGVDPSHQGTGMGGALLRRLNQAADAAHMPCYLETDEERNVGLYRRYGYDIIDEADTPFGFHMWHMKRSPVTPTSSS
ncbi:MAG TPA: GNAT family N-acetyltransferase [Kofleriaceae bacterium]|nr:GNAT family N-acetyltransferase [Kofleriaceae bacterium]